jgi:TetR/AcrR family tetracycline transcriptional repressor
MNTVARERSAQRGSGRPDDRAEPGAAPRRGRPPRLSRDRIIDAVYSLLEQDSAESLTIGRIARAVDASPAALYRHFESLDDLLDAVLARALSNVDATLDAEADWAERLGDWMRGLRGELRRVPSAIALIGRSGRTSPAWLEASSVLVGLLEAAGLEGRQLAMLYLWILETTTGFVLQEAILPVSDQLANAWVSVGELSDTARERFASIRPELDRVGGDDFFSFVVEQAIAVVALHAERSARR